MKYIKINKNNIDYLKRFLKEIGSSKEYFRYYESKSLDVIENHIYTILGIDKLDNPISYGHLDLEDNSIWLGICVKEGETGKGLGEKIISKLIDYAINKKIKKIRLSVDNINKPAINLYLKMNFKFEKKEKDKSFYSLDIKHNVKTKK